MSKNLYIIQDCIGCVGNQLAGSRARAVELFRAKNPDSLGKLNAYAANGMDGEDMHADAWQPTGESLDDVIARDLGH